MPDELVRTPAPPARTRRDWEIYEKHGRCCFFCRSVYHPTRTVLGELRESPLLACDHPHCQFGPMTKWCALHRGCAYFKEDDRVGN